MAVEYTIKYLEEIIDKHIKVLPQNIKIIIKQAIEERLGTNPVGYGKPLRYSLKGYRRLRVGDYRIVYSINEKDKIVIILAIKHRKDIYN